MTLASPLVERSEACAPFLPSARGPYSAWVRRTLLGGVAPMPDVRTGPRDALGDDDLHLALYLCYELHYAGFDGVDVDREWDAEILAFRARLEGAFEAAIRDNLPPPPVATSATAAVRALAERERGPSLSRHLAEAGTLQQFREFAVHRSPYQLKEADPHSWAIPRFRGPTQVALCHIQAGEYGDGDPGRAHSALFAETMDALGLDSSYGAYVDAVPGVTLATVNLISMLGLHRRLRGALLGHLAMFEMTSVEPMGRYSRALVRLGVDAKARRFFDAHVVADEEHERVAAAMLDAATEAEPGLHEAIVFGAAAVLLVERRFSEHLLRAWRHHRSSLRGHPFLG
jgi:hypothetical protein